jgi:hypothetical protein
MDGRRLPPAVAFTTAGVASSLCLLLTGCGGEDGATTGGTTPQAQTSLPQGSEPVEMDPARFSPDIDHEYWPMEPGTRWTYREVDEDGSQLQVVVTVSSETREIANGITARVVRDTVTDDGSIIEDTLDWYAQDTDGNVWYLGEDTAEFEEGSLTTRDGSFEAGVDGASAGVVMPSEPEDGMAYRQEYYAGEAEDNGEVVELDQQVDVVAGHYDDVLVTADTTALEPDVLEFKFYAPGVGPVLTLGLSGGLGREELVRRTTVPEAVAEAAGTTPLGEGYG